MNLPGPAVLRAEIYKIRNRHQKGASLRDLQDDPHLLLSGPLIV